MLYAGVDLGKRYCYVTVMDAGGAIVKQGKVASEPDALLEALAKNEDPMSVAIEACRDWYSVYDLLDQAGLDLSLVHPLKAKPITGAEVTLSNGHHLTLLCETQRGYANLCRLLTHAHLDHERGKPCVEPEVLARHPMASTYRSPNDNGTIYAIPTERGWNYWPLSWLTC
ncbi:MAG: PHP domain-containing protein [Dehalococcoidia bacterium]